MAIPLSTRAPSNVQARGALPGLQYFAGTDKGSELAQQTREALSFLHDAKQSPSDVLAKLFEELPDTVAFHSTVNQELYKLGQVIKDKGGEILKENFDEILSKTRQGINDAEENKPYVHADVLDWTYSQSEDLKGFTISQFSPRIDLDDQSLNVTFTRPVSDSLNLEYYLTVEKAKYHNPDNLLTVKDPSFALVDSNGDRVNF